MRLSNHIFMHLLDGQEHCLEEFADYLLDSIEPSLAMKAFMRRVKKISDGIPIGQMGMEKKVEIGSRVIITTCLSAMRKEGYINWETHPFGRPERWRDGKVQLTKTGIEHLRKSRQGLGEVINELRRLFCSGQIDIVFRPTESYVDVKEWKDEEVGEAAAS